MPTPVTFKVLRALGGSCNFAESTVVVEHGGADGNRVAASPALLASEYSWAARDAIRGASAALDEFGNDGDRVIIDAMRVTVVDSNADNIAVSAYIATARAFGVNVDLDTFINDGRITFAGRDR